MDESLLITVLLFLCFAIQHSVTISDPFKAWMIRLFGKRFYQGYYRILFTAANILILLFMIPYLAALPDHHLFTYSTWTRLGMRILQCFGIWVFIQAGKKTDFLYFIGVRQVIRHKKGEPESDDETLIRDGIYGRVRHPLYLGSILVLWGEPYLVSARNGLIIVILSTLYFYLGSMLEERRMVRQLGDEYRRYQREVPRLFPFRWNRR